MGAEGTGAAPQRPVLCRSPCLVLVWRIEDNVASVTTLRRRGADQNRVAYRPHQGPARRSPWTRALSALAGAAVLLASGCAFNPNLDPRPLDPSASTRVLAADGSLLAAL